MVAVLGHPIAHTASPVMHNAAFDALGLNWRYLAFDVHPNHLRDALRGLAATGMAGVNLTLPHKILAMRYLNYVEKGVVQLGNSNTLQFSMMNHQPVIRGYNTDGHGLLMALDEEFSFRPRDKTVAIIGCGGAGRSAAIQLALAGAKKLILLNRTRSKALATARRILALKIRTTCVFAPEKCDLVIQATSLGLKNSDPLPVSHRDFERLRPVFCFDMVYRPAITSMMRAAGKTGCRTAGGLGMLLHQGARAFEIWTGHRAPIKVMRCALEKEIYG